MEFVRRFLLHVLPRGFMRVRYYGLLANCQRKTLLARCRELLRVTQPTAESGGPGTLGETASVETAATAVQPMDEARRAILERAAVAGAKDTDPSLVREWVALKYHGVRPTGSKKP